LTPSLYCRQCGTRLPIDSPFCPTCGTSQAGTDHTLTSPSQPKSAGRLLHQRYRLQQTLGQGGMGAVYLAQDTQLGNRLVAVKEMSTSRLLPSEVPHAVAQFRNEAHLLASLHHPNLPAIHEYFSAEDRWYLVMSFIEGQSLQSLLDAAPSNKLPVEQVVRIGLELCEALEYLHTHDPQIIFRDLKPLNIMLTPKGHVCLIDFGIARHFKPEQANDTAPYYTVGYAPPEQYGQAQTSPHSDIYSLGATLHQMLSGHDPSKQPFQFALLHLADSALPESLSTLIAHMVEMNEQARPASVAEIKEQLECVPTPQHRVPTQKAQLGKPKLTIPQSSLPVLPLPPQPGKMRIPAKTSVSRRLALSTLVGLIIIALTSSIAWFVTQHATLAGNPTAHATVPVRSPTTHPTISAGITTEFAIHTVNSEPNEIVTGPDGNLWFTESTGNNISRITPQGTVITFPLPTPKSNPAGITTGPDGNLWFTESAGNKIGRITPQDTITEFLLPTLNGTPGRITIGPDHNLWFTERNGNKIGRITPQGTITEFLLPTPNSTPEGITTGPDSNLWFTEYSGNKIGRITPQGTITEFLLPTPNSISEGITTGPDGNLWFTEFGGKKIGHITLSGTITEFSLPSLRGRPYGITTGPDHNLWFTEFDGNKVDRITFQGLITEFPLPIADRGPHGITTGPDGNLWFTEYASSQIGRITSGK
jgi:serine/threonine protein kinase